MPVQCRHRRCGSGVGIGGSSRSELARGAGLWAAQLWEGGKEGMVRKLERRRGLDGVVPDAQLRERREIKLDDLELRQHHAQVYIGQCSIRSNRNQRALCKVVAVTYRVANASRENAFACTWRARQHARRQVVQCLGDFIASLVDVGRCCLGLRLLGRR